MAEKKENSSEKKGIAAWLELPETEKKLAAAAMRRQGGSYAHAADALEELSDDPLVEKLGGREALQELLNFFGDWPQPWDEGDPGPARRAITLVKKYEEKFAALRQPVFIGDCFGCGRSGCPNCAPDTEPE